MNVRIAICEDEEYTSSRYKDAIVKRLGQSAVDVQTYTTKQEIMLAYEEKRPFDIVILDVELQDSEKGGFHIAKKIRELDQDVYILYLTSHEESSYIIDAINTVGAIGYVIKSPDLAIFYDKLIQVNQLVLQDRENVLCIKQKHRIAFVFQKDVLYIESFKNRKEIHTLNQPEPYSLYISFDEIFSKLDIHNFAEIARGSFVNMAKIESFFIGNGDVHLTNGEKLNASRSKRTSAYQTFEQYLERVMME